MRNITNLLIVIGLFISASFAYAAPVNINTADVAMLTTNIKGVGSKKARAIIQYRKSNGPFKRVDDIVRVKGIGAKLLEKNRANLLIAPPKTKKN